jgi:succinate dehydrogenase / fumarate reductase, iron-sulfur subunit
MNTLIQKIRLLGRKRNTANDRSEHHHATDENKRVRENISLRVFRANAAKQSGAHTFDYFKIPLKRWTTVLDALIYAKSYKVFM